MPTIFKRNIIFIFFYRLIKVSLFRIIFDTPIYKLFYQHDLENIFDSQKKYRLVVCHNGGGGTGSYLIKKYGNLQGVLILRKIFTAEKDYLYSIENSDTHKIIYIKPKQIIAIQNNISEINIVAVESFMDVEFILNWFISLNVPITYDLHDYHCIWYEAHYVHNGKFLTKEDLEKSTLRYLGLRNTYNNWHKIWNSFFPHVQQINAFSESSKNIFSEYYPEFANKVIVKPHSLEYINYNQINKIPQKFTVGIFGMINDVDKGSQIVHQFLKYSRNKGYEIYFNGELKSSAKVKASNIHYMGRYDVNKLDKIITEQGISVVLFPSICPETFSYTVSELIHAGIPVACFNIGAQAEKVSQYKYGQIINGYSNQAIYYALKTAYYKGLNIEDDQEIENEIPLTLKEIQSIELNILSDFADYCNSNNLKYYLGYGTLLGAARHKGFIPWDDDIDVLMPRSDYNRFIELTGFNPIKNHLETRYYRDCLHPNIYPYIKVIDKNTIVYEKGKSKKNLSGIWIDVFPLDGYPEDQKKVQKLYSKYITLRKLQDLATTNPFYVNQNLVNKIIKTLFLAPLIKLYGVKRICRKIDLLGQTYSFDDCNAVTDFTWPDNTSTFLYKNELEPAVKLPIENRLFNAPAGWEKYLERLYGEWKQLPPENQRIPHGFLAYNCKKS